MDCFDSYGPLGQVVICIFQYLALPTIQLLKIGTGQGGTLRQLERAGDTVTQTKQKWLWHVIPLDEPVNKMAPVPSGKHTKTKDVPKKHQSGRMSTWPHQVSNQLQLSPLTEMPERGYHWMNKLPPDSYESNPMVQYWENNDTFQIKIQGQATNYADGSGDEDHSKLDDDNPFIECHPLEKNLDEHIGSEKDMADDNEHQGQSSDSGISKDEGERELDKHEHEPKNKNKNEDEDENKNKNEDEDEDNAVQ
ncbi:hypothetical protein HD554DRAFT_2038388 [Boletus coccyginus]|nr:hypothetical protein HD554DRAFT_2038388 [Boletus coccyginus]